MRKEFVEIKFKNRDNSKSEFDIVKLEDIINGSPKDHNQFDFHKVPFYAILICTDKSGLYNINFHDYKINKGALFFLRKDYVHKFYKNKAKGLLLVFTEDFVLSNSNQLEASKTFLLFNEMLASPKLNLNKEDYNEVTALISLIKEEYFHKTDYFQSVLSEA